MTGEMNSVGNERTTGHYPAESRHGGDIAGMQWEKFVQVMVDRGFICVPSVSGSIVRFDPQTRRTDLSRSTNATYPDPTISSKKLRDFSKKLQEYYGWDPEDFLLKATGQ
ncbi:hypothetical protein C8Q70DRAFT_1052382 [Cubamyces menziesii]|nr:hypothetical protein C8Q70DRAFT_1052382 [Cubamyces menziesii]